MYSRPCGYAYDANIRIWPPAAALTTGRPEGLELPSYLFHPCPCWHEGDGDTFLPLPVLEEGHPLRRAQREDLQALALTLLELAFSALAGEGPSPATAADALQRLLFDVFQRDISEFRYGGLRRGRSAARSAR